ncbi:MAG: hypothetical protein MR743_03755 [Oscillospiraceae bacterium]|nr:hypothetical protein [Oscillospiraceae bacterium]
MLSDIILDIFSGVISSLFLWICSSVVAWAKKADAPKPPSVPIKTVRHQFYFFACLFPISLSIALLIPYSLTISLKGILLASIKIICILTALFSFIFELGAFQIASFFQKSANSVEVPTNNSANDNADQT